MGDCPCFVEIKLLLHGALSGLLNDLVSVKRRLKNTFNKHINTFQLEFLKNNIHWCLMIKYRTVMIEKRSRKVGTSSFITTQSVC